MLYSNKLCKYKLNKLIGYETETNEARVKNKRVVAAANEGPLGRILVPLYSTNEVVLESAYFFF